MREFFGENIKLSFIDEKLIFIITKDDFVYNFERDLRNTSIIAFSFDFSFIISKIVEELYHKQIADFSRGDKHSITRILEAISIAGVTICPNSWQMGNKWISIIIYEN